MIPALKSEFKKLFSVRSTYLFILLALILIGIFSFYGEGFKDSANLMNHPKPAGSGAVFIASTIDQIGHFASLLGGIIALLLITHEYRHNTITYTLTSSNSRTKVLFSKFLAVFGFAFLYSFLLTLYGVGMIYLGLHFSHNIIPHQDISYLTFFGKTLFHTEGFALAALLIGFLIRNQVGAFAALLIIPSVVEGLLGLILRHDSVYLPFMSLDQVITPPSLTRTNVNVGPNGYLSPAKSALVFLVYLVVGWIVGWVLFLRRDAT